MSSAHDDDPQLDDFVAGIRAQAERRELRPRPDFAEVMRRAQAMDPAAIDDAALDEAASLAEVVPLGAGAAADCEPDEDPELDAFVAAVRDHNLAVADERRMAGIPELALLRARRPGTSRRPLFAGLIALAAALLLVFVGGGPRLAQRGSGPTAQAMARQAARLAEEIGRSAQQESAAHRAAEGAREGVARVNGEDVRSDTNEETGEEADADRDAGAQSDDAETNADTRPHHAKRPQRRAPADDASLDDALAALDAEAQRRWRAGDLRGAESAFREIIRRDRAGRWAQLAYGDLFAVARQTGDRGAELRLWREYLRRHPRGPHADDAQAGICRRGGDAAIDCWREYLALRPRGAFRAEAKLAVGAVERPEEDAP